MKNEIRRNEDGTIDEIVVSGVDLHIEQMDKGYWWMGIYSRENDKVLLLGFCSKKKIDLNIEYNALIDEAVTTPAAITKSG